MKETKQDRFDVIFLPVVLIAWSVALAVLLYGGKNSQVNPAIINKTDSINKK